MILKKNDWIDVTEGICLQAFILYFLSGRHNPGPTFCGIALLFPRTTFKTDFRRISRVSSCMCIYVYIAMSDSPAGSHFETGSLTLRAPQQSEFIGSSSGVHFIKLVRAVCANTPVASHAIPNNNGLRTEDILGEDNDDSDATVRCSSLPSQTALQDCSAIPETNSSLPSQLEAQAMAVQYFGLWHPLLPFLYGPVFMRDLNDLYRGALKEHSTAQAPSRTACHTFLLRCL